MNTYYYKAQLPDESYVNYTWFNILSGEAELHLHKTKKRPFATLAGAKGNITGMKNKVRKFRVNRFKVSIRDGSDNSENVLTMAWIDDSVVPSRFFSVLDSLELFREPERVKFTKPWKMKWYNKYWTGNFCHKCGMHFYRVPRYSQLCSFCLVELGEIASEKLKLMGTKEREYMFQSRIMAKVVANEKLRNSKTFRV